MGLGSHHLSQSILCLKSIHVQQHHAIIRNTQIFHHQDLDHRPKTLETITSYTQGQRNSRSRDPQVTALCSDIWSANEQIPLCRFPTFRMLITTCTRSRKPGCCHHDLVQQPMLHVVHFTIVQLHYCQLKPLEE